MPTGLFHLPFSFDRFILSYASSCRHEGVAVVTIIQQSLPSFLHSQQAHGIFKAVGRRSDDSRLSTPLALSVARVRTRALQAKWRKLVTPSTPATDYQAVAAADGSTSGSTNTHTGTDT